ncbi:MAG: MFS transporter, partial [Oscillospiraceae bacterium]|nr:MFS transporter [Oscillospiraceae bacterium]
MKKIPNETWANIRQGLRHPIAWLKGMDIPEGHITPWELLLFAASKALGTMSSGFTGRQDFLYKEVYRIDLKKLSLAGIISSLWDASNDPFLGAWMDRKRMGINTLRTIMRISAVTVNVLNVAKLFDGGLSDWQHVGILIACNCAQDIIGTMDGVAQQKIRAGISPFSQQRGRVSVWTNMGYQVGWGVSNLPVALMALRDIFHLSDYQIIMVGALILLPLGIVSSVLTSFVRQRVDFTREQPVRLE